MENAFGNLTLSGTGKTLLNKLRAKEITFAEFMQECAYWTIKDGFDELRALPLPTAPGTQAFKDYENLLPAQKAKLDPIYFSKNPEINEYYRQVFMVKKHNIDVLNWLKEISAHIPKEDTITQQVIETKLLNLNVWFEDNSTIVEKTKEIFDAEEIPDNYT